MTSAKKTRHIGLLFVHGIGEQERWDHLRNSVRELAELILQTEGQPRVTVTDRTENWPHPPGEQNPDGLAPITLRVWLDGEDIAFECHEVWWADLGARAGIVDVVTFWLWGLGQWCAPIYRDLDAARLSKEQRAGLNKPTSRYATLPESVAGSLLSEPLARLQLVLAALAAAFVACSWSLAKRLFSALLGQAPTPTLIVRYVGDVRTYESRAAPGDSALSDPGRPRRVGIRRRMVSEMVAMGTRPCDGWYVIAHSLGTVLAYNGLTETGHALPNYLTEAQWARIHKNFKTDPNCQTRDNLAAMMPARPAWLGDKDVLNRHKLFEKLRGFLTYGSPLDKFAALWPRIVATATDRVDGKNPFPEDCRWVNLVAPSDPVAGTLDSYGGRLGKRLACAVPPLENLRTPWSPLYGLSHITYFAGIERSAASRAARQKRAVARWLVTGGAQKIPDHKQGRVARLLFGQLAYPLLVGLLWLAATAFVVASFGAIADLIGQGQFEWARFLEAWKAAWGPVMGVTLAVILLMGLIRWVRESRLNLTLARADRESDRNQTAERRGYWTRIVWMLGAQVWVGAVLTVIGVVLILFGAALDWGVPAGWTGLPDWMPDPRTLRGLAPEAWREALGGWWLAIVSLAGLVLAAMAQTGLNKIVPPVGKAPG